MHTKQKEQWDDSPDPHTPIALARVQEDDGHGKDKGIS